MAILKYWFRRIFLTHKMTSMSRRILMSTRYNTNKYMVQIYNNDSFVFSGPECVFYNEDNKISNFHYTLLRLKNYVNSDRDLYEQNR